MEVNTGAYEWQAEVLKCHPEWLMHAGGQKQRHVKRSSQTLKTLHKETKYLDQKVKCSWSFVSLSLGVSLQSPVWSSEGAVPMSRRRGTSGSTCRISFIFSTWKQQVYFLGNERLPKKDVWKTGGMDG